LKKNKVSKNWLIQNKKDYYINKSKLEGFRSRSAYKLIEMDDKFQFLKNNTNLLDLGSSPGGWSQVASKKIRKGKIMAIDIKPMEKVDRVKFINIDLNSKDEVFRNIQDYFGFSIDVVVSDMAANTSGNKNLDSYRTAELCLKGMDIASEFLNEKGVFLSKFFMGSSFEEIKRKAKQQYKKIVIYKPKSSKKKSKEIYMYCKDPIKTF